MRYLGLQIVLTASLTHEAAVSHMQPIISGLFILECNREEFVYVMTCLACGVMSHLNAHTDFIPIKSKALVKMAGLC